MRLSNSEHLRAFAKRGRAGHALAVISFAHPIGCITFTSHAAFAIYAIALAIYAIALAIYAIARCFRAITLTVSPPAHA
jgi:hypothetical protein